MKKAKLRIRNYPNFLFAVRNLLFYHKLNYPLYFVFVFAFSATPPIQIVARTAIMVTTTAYVSIGYIPVVSPKTSLNIAIIAPFHANAATKPKAAVIKAAIFSITSVFNFITPRFLKGLLFPYNIMHIQS